MRAGRQADVLQIATPWGRQRGATLTDRAESDLAARHTEQSPRPTQRRPRGQQAGGTEETSGDMTARSTRGDMTARSGGRGDMTARSGASHRSERDIAVDLISVLDTNGDGVVDMDEFIAGGGSQSEFKQYDTNGDGMLDVDELSAIRRMMRACQEEAEEEKRQAKQAEADRLAQAEKKQKEADILAADVEAARARKAALEKEFARLQPVDQDVVARAQKELETKTKTIVLDDRGFIASDVRERPLLSPDWLSCSADGFSWLTVSHCFSLFLTVSHTHSHAHQHSAYCLL